MPLLAQSKTVHGGRLVLFSLSSPPPPPSTSKVQGLGFSNLRAISVLCYKQLEQPPITSLLPFTGTEAEALEDRSGSASTDKRPLLLYNTILWAGPVSNEITITSSESKLREDTGLTFK